MLFTETKFTTSVNDTCTIFTTGVESIRVLYTVDIPIIINDEMIGDEALSTATNSIRLNDLIFNTDDPECGVFRLKLPITKRYELYPTAFVEAPR